MFPDIHLTLGIEEEYQIINPETRDLQSYVQNFLEQGREVFPTEQLKAEFMQSQVEVSSHISQNVQELRAEVTRLRRTVGALAANNGLKIVAASSHPFAEWGIQTITEGERYRMHLDNMRAVAEQLLIFGMHVHIGFGEGPTNWELMTEVMNQLRYFLPHILAMSTSSPFWQGRNTGLKSYRSVVFENLPRTGIPHSFSSYSEYEAYVRLLAKTGSIQTKGDGNPDATTIWWDVRPHPTFGTLEVRIADVCTLVDDAVCIAATVQAVVAMLIQLRRGNRGWRRYRRHHIVENKWRAMRYGIEGKLIDFGLEQEVPFASLAEELVELLDDVVDELGSRQEVSHVAQIIQHGTSAEKQLTVYDEALASGSDELDALHCVVDHLVVETMKGVG